MVLEGDDHESLVTPRQQWEIISHLASNTTLAVGQWWFMVSAAWIRAWREYCEDITGKARHPGPVRTSDLLHARAGTVGLARTREGLRSEEDYGVVPQEAWEKLVTWYGLEEASRPIARPVVGVDDEVKLALELSVFKYRVGTEDIREACVPPGTTVGQVKQAFREGSKGRTLSFVLEERDEEGDIDECLVENVLGGGTVLRVLEESPSTAADAPLQLSSESGVRGLVNLGNTCFMNSALQCLSNCEPLTLYFLQDRHLAELNRTNPLGTGGLLAMAYGDMMREMWQGKLTGPVNPSRFKMTLGRFETRFLGYHQQDSQELLSALLDRLHEDVNRVVTKPYVELRDSEGRPDAVVAEEAWRSHRLRNDSIIVDKFHGQFKSTVVCPECGYESVTFDPFLFVSLPLPQARTTMYRACVVRGAGTVMVDVPLDKPDATVGEMLSALRDVLALPDAELVAAEIYDNSVYEVISSEGVRLSRFNSAYGSLKVYEAEGRDDFWVSFRSKDSIGLSRSVGTPLLLSAGTAGAQVRIERAVKQLLALSHPRLDPDRLDLDQLMVIAEDRLMGAECKYPGYVVEFSDRAFHDACGMEVEGMFEVLQPRETRVPEHAAAVTLQQCLNTFSMRERLVDGELWYCKQCRKHQQATKKMDLWRLPEILVVHLKRFSYDHLWGEKISTPVEFPLHDFRPQQDGCAYDLFGISNHYGGLGGGHYTATAQNFHSRKWYCFDDACVSEVADPAQLASRQARKSAYMLFYQRRQTPLASRSVE